MDVGGTTKDRVTKVVGLQGDYSGRKRFDLGRVVSIIGLTLGGGTITIGLGVLHVKSGQGSRVLYGLEAGLDNVTICYLTTYSSGVVVCVTGYTYGYT